MVVNPGKFQIISLGSNIDNSKIIFMIENHRVKSRSAVKLLVITIEISCRSLHMLKTYAAHQVILFRQSINPAYVLYMKWKMQILKIC